MKASLLQQLTEIRFQMDDILRMQYATQYNEARPHLPFNIDYEFDYDFDAEKLAKDDMGITEEVVQDLKTLKTNPDVQASGFFNQTYEMVHRGGEFMDFSIVKLQIYHKKLVSHGTIQLYMHLMCLKFQLEFKKPMKQMWRVEMMCKIKMFGF